MKHVVLVPSWRRPDMLHACLTRLAEDAVDAGDVTVIVSLDRGYDKACLDVVEDMHPEFDNLCLRPMPQHSYRGNSYNVISGLAECLRLGGDLTHVVEEDVLVARGYFTFHEATHTVRPDVFAVSACRNQNLAGDPPDVAYTDRSYQSLGVSFRRRIVQRIVRHDTHAYYGSMIDYCKTKFPHSGIPAGNAEQDGLINRIREEGFGQTLYTSRPRAYHAGFHGYNRPGTPLTEGTVQERAARILTMTSAELNALSSEFKDYEAIDLDTAMDTLPEEQALIRQGLLTSQCLEVDA